MNKDSRGTTGSVCSHPAGKKMTEQSKTITFHRVREEAAEQLHYAVVRCACGAHPPDTMSDNDACRWMIDHLDTEAALHALRSGPLTDHDRLFVLEVLIRTLRGQEGSGSE